MSPGRTGDPAAVDAAEHAAVLAALGGVGELDGRVDMAGLVRLGGMSNVSYRVDVAGRRYVVRLPGPGGALMIDREVEMHNSRVAAAHGLGAPVVFADPDREVLVSRFIGGRVLSADDVADVAMLDRVGRLLRRVHGMDPRRFRGRFAPFTMIDRYRAHLAATGVAIDAEHEALIGRVQPLRTALSTVAEHAPCHNDPWPSNIIVGDDSLVLIDWEYSGMGDPLWDLAHFAVEAHLDRERTEHLLAAWYDGPVPPRQFARFTLWRPITDLVWGLWAKMQRAGGSPIADLDVYADRRLRNARARLDGDGIIDALAALSA